MDVTAAHRNPPPGAAQASTATHRRTRPRTRRPTPPHWPRTFPCTTRSALGDYAFFRSSTRSRILRAATLASNAWDDAVAEDRWDKITLHMFRLAVFGKVYELNQGEWDNRFHLPSLDDWMAETTHMMFFAYRLAGYQLHQHRQSIPKLVDVIPFTRACLDYCTTEDLDPDISDYMKTRPSFRFDLGVFDPVNIPEENYGYRCTEIVYTYRRRLGKYIRVKGGEREYACDELGNPLSLVHERVVPSPSKNGRVVHSGQPVAASVLNRSTGSTGTELSENAPGSLSSDHGHSSSGRAASPRLLSPRTSLDARDDKAVTHSPVLVAHESCHGLTGLEDAFLELNKRPPSPVETSSDV
ncbi:hypothetical protein A1Q2_04521 [Trichosporon asahii var. asahii CBS 8904]|uniref:Uncharacterized protein n=1 Tax=Trichosporon asahii var. asahii (strain CBS 8904) TaxID=1220162 RepID=K1VWM7_TRIAC|nr:hypothetical protein A1Q2_04521 [Trichosporon asahii var. asahii CBS 8904]